MSSTISDQQVIQSFHILLQTSLAQAKAERLLDPDTLSNAEADLMINGPALCMYFAALRCTTSPPTITLPRVDKSRPQPPVLLSLANCPPAFLPMLRAWSGLVPRIRELAPEYQHDLARTICGLEQLSQPINPELEHITAELRSIAIEISQRRSFQERYATDLQAALDSGPSPSSGGTSNVKTRFRPPPSYDEDSSAGSSSGHSTSLSSSSLPSESSGSVYSAEPAPSLREMSVIEIIRETLYAALADVIAETPSIRPLLISDPPRAYFSSVALAILRVAQTNVTASGSVRGVMGIAIKLGNCPQLWRPLMTELGAVARQSRVIADEDDAVAMNLVADELPIPEPRLERVKRRLERGVGYEERRTPATEEGNMEARAVPFANRLNALALGLSKLPTFRERQDHVFAVLAASS